MRNTYNTAKMTLPEWFITLKKQYPHIWEYKTRKSATTKKELRKKRITENRINLYIKIK